ncbi:transposase [Mesorhizobium sp. M1428]|uniref:transposase n=1 Tax=Mesorhizobium sp. M1428 TaxID=2957102 RepID=UPI0033350D68
MPNGWRHEDKIRIDEESFEPGAVVYDVARRHEIADSVLFKLGATSAGAVLERRGGNGICPGPISEADLSGR